MYIVFLHLREKKEIEIGALGEKVFQPGTYAYIGSAMNSMESRVSRHFSIQKKLHWHIDYFTQEAEAVAWTGFATGSSWECLLAETAAENSEPVDGFGSSDCSCNSHLLRVSGECLDIPPEGF